MAALRSVNPTLRLVFFLAGARPVIDFLEELEVLLNLRVVWFELDGFLVGLPRFVELAFVLVRDRQIVVGGGVGRVEFGRFFPAVDGFAPEPALGHVDPEFDLRLRVGARVGERRRRRQKRRDENEHGRKAHAHEGVKPHYSRKRSKAYATPLPENPASFCESVPQGFTKHGQSCPRSFGGFDRADVCATGIMNSWRPGPRNSSRGGLGLLCVSARTVRRCARPRQNAVTVIDLSALVQLSLLPLRRRQFTGERLRAGTPPASILEELLEQSVHQLDKRPTIAERASRALRVAEHAGIMAIGWGAAAYPQALAA